MVQAAEKLNQIREQGGSVADYLAQQGLFGEDMNAVSRELLAFFEEHKRSGKAIATLLRNYYDALAAQGNPNQADVFGEQAAPDKQQLLERTINDYEQEHGRSADSGQLFERADRPAGEPVSETEQQAAHANIHHGAAQSLHPHAFAWVVVRSCLGALVVHVVKHPPHPP